MAERTVRIITKQTAVPGRIPTGTTGNELNFIKQGELAQNTADKKLYGFNGTNVFEYGTSSFLSVLGGTISGNTNVSGSLSASTLFSGGTNLYNIFSTTDTNDITRVQPGSNISTGGTGNNPIVNVVASPSFNNTTVSGTSTNNALSATTLSAGTIMSGGTNLYNIFSTTDTNDITRVQPGSNISTGGTGNNPTVNVVASPSFNNITGSGTTIVNVLSANTITVTGTSNLNGTIISTNLTGTTSRFVEASSGGTISATRDIISAYLSSGGTTATLLENTSNWDINGNYIGTALSGTYQGQKHYNQDYLFEAVADNIFIRLIRG